MQVVTVLGSAKLFLIMNSICCCTTHRLYFSFYFIVHCKAVVDYFADRPDNLVSYARVLARPAPGVVFFNCLFVLADSFVWRKCEFFFLHSLVVLLC
jgi:hypothetical protein